ncbi:DUF2156 domain-containing protein [Porphyromonas sp. COT-290 OH860]|uniref:DUF2156 domain-containing protein n=1 Tax=Porphyromonas sp. COT-290 OH860 TaxID=1515615 RepID=UPI00052BD62D|nr:phosphatidylglycerol lysyltransferase domain-containing protein [Porphyromonas sp. COT-290 OH860]KGN84452.1 hypothetical protein HQ41_04435 [Porphyromonas sp. COT-290 OH860]
MESIVFKPVSLEDKEIIQSFTLKGSSQICDLAFANLYGWSERYGTSWAILHDTLVISFQPLGRSHPAFLMPICDSPQSFTQCLEALKILANEGGYPLVLMGVGPMCRQKLDALAPNAFHYISDEGSRDYIYLREKMSTLSGKSLQSKRNHINKFERLYPDYSYEPITRNNLEECLAIAEAWLEQSDDHGGEQEEKRMIRRITQAFEPLGLLGGAIRVNGRIIAFSLGSPINENTFGVHVEKALVEYEGAFAMINREFARHIPEQYTYINREEDLGLEGLRKSKLSYKPEIIFPKDVALLRYDS